jgi:hypothetical protein
VAVSSTPQRSFGTLILQSVTAGERWGVRQQHTYCLDRSDEHSC